MNKKLLVSDLESILLQPRCPSLDCNLLTSLFKHVSTRATAKYYFNTRSAQSKEIVEEPLCMTWGHLLGYAHILWDVVWGNVGSRVRFFFRVVK
jgi:hypothetical protein